ncbi:hypothetical protein [Streptomyces buecherae]|uniref:hypothetical protein n=1 Tax=Streptomyces buecherae TaxID=2763006 RepID=UPI001C2758A5|nr:hypothetical protein [Streptomyces buecherae]
MTTNYVDVVRWLRTDPAQPIPEGVLSKAVYDALNAVLDGGQFATGRENSVLRDATLPVTSVARHRGSAAAEVESLLALRDQAPMVITVSYTRRLASSFLALVDDLLKDAVDCTALDRRDNEVPLCATETATCYACRRGAGCPGSIPQGGRR